MPSLSILDGWWLEGCSENITGWAIGDRPQAIDPDDSHTRRDATALYDKLESVVALRY